MRVDILTERTALFGLWRARAVSCTGDKKPHEPGGLDLEPPTYDFVHRWFYAFSAEAAEDKAVAWARKRMYPKSENTTTRDVRP